jgi:cobalt/nickel transport protein
VSAPRRGALFWVLFALATMIIAGGVSYLASPHPDGLDATTLRGCQVVERGGVEELAGQCIAQHATDHALAGSPLADYAVGGAKHSAGLAGVIGVLFTLAAAGVAFRVIARRPGRRAPAHTSPAGGP